MPAVQQGINEGAIEITSVLQLVIVQACNVTLREIWSTVPRYVIAQIIFV